MAKKKTETVVVTWRVKEALRRRLEVAAAHNEVSVNAEITRRMEESFTRAELASLTENVDRLSALYVHTRLLSKLVERNRLYAEKCLQLVRTFNDSESKLNLLNLAKGWLDLAAQKSASNPTSDDTALDLADALAPPAPAETDEERQTRLRALADDLRKNAERRSDARGAHDLAAEQREWDTRSIPSSRTMAERLTAALGLAETRSEPDQEPELPMPRKKVGKS
jgi:hypothetical protein